jgi:hypothetical protein
MITIDATGRIIPDLPTPHALESRWCMTTFCPVCHERTNEAYRVIVPSVNLMHGVVMCFEWVEGHVECYPRLGQAVMDWRQLQTEWTI